MISLSTVIDGLQHLWWLGWLMGLSGWGMFFLLNKVAESTLALYRRSEKEHEVRHEKWHDLYKESQRLCLDLLKVHEPDQCEIALNGLSELYAKDLMNRNATKRNVHGTSK